jgi:translation elongation factor EF-Tu-like GTPase
MENIKQWGKNIIVILNKVDVLKQEGQREEVIHFVKDGISKLLGFEPKVFPVSSFETLNSKFNLDSPKEEWISLEKYFLSSYD